MARFFFDLHECGAYSKDEEGVERSNLQSLRQEALAAARDVMCGELKEGRLCLGRHIDVRDDAGKVVLTVPFKEAVSISGL